MPVMLIFMLPKYKLCRLDYGKFDQEKPLLDYYSFLVGQPLNFTKICIKQKVLQKFCLLAMLA